ncbi:MAG: triose-phosphate isomerase [Bacteroidota bacterium]
MRKKIVAGNWKMNTTLQDGVELARQIANGSYSATQNVILCTPATHLAKVAEIIDVNDKVALGAQNCHEAAKGAYTGEISVDMIKSTGATHVILGHSERRAIYHESHELLKAKLETVLGAGLIPIFCCGEKLAVREAGDHVELVAKQLEDSLFGLSEADFQKVIVAYEPVWAIGTGVTASPEQAQEMHAEIRKMIANRYNAAIADDTTILYGGSVKPANAKALFDQDDVDGGLVGGASLKAETFVPIIEAI